jgi:homogentisate 1,2-dioxygenase
MGGSRRIRGAHGVTAPAYLSGFGNELESEAVPGSLPIGRNSPQKVDHGLYAEQLSGTAFTAPQASNRRSWLYRIRPSVRHIGRFKRVGRGALRSAPDREDTDSTIGPLRWSPMPIPKRALTFVTGLHTVTLAGNVDLQTGMAVHVLVATQSMVREHFCNADGELLVVPQQGGLRFVTELGVLDVSPGEICVIPRGVIFRVELAAPHARAYVCENYGRSFALPERGLLGANGLANSRDFLAPVAAYEDDETPHTLVVKSGGELYRTRVPHSPLDVVAWHGNHHPYKYDLRRFCPIGPVLFDHFDPSINTVLTSTSDTPGTANVDFVIFPERWIVTENTFRPPWYHRNAMSEFMGLVYGVYDAKPEGFVPGGFSLHNQLLPHGPDGEAFERASNAVLEPVKLANTLAFMFESRYRQRITRYAASSPSLQHDYVDCWSGLGKRFKGRRRDAR